MSLPAFSDLSQRYNEVVIKADLADHSAVRGCMVIKPYAYTMREHMRTYLDACFKKTWHKNAYFPLFIPKSFFTKEATHVDGFATEAAIVTHYRLKKNDAWEMIVDPEAKLEEELIVRPTSETIIWNTYKDWIQSYRDLPLLINQWANVVRREMRTRPFLRTAEFLWQEGHTAHATAQEAQEETRQMRAVYADFFEHIMALPGIKGKKSESEKFAWAVDTYTIEMMMPDGKALQSCTSHYLWQNFGKAFDVTFVTKENTTEFAYATSWWISTRALGGMIMAHGDDTGIRVPPAIAPIHCVIIPIAKDEAWNTALLDYLQPVIQELNNGVFTITSWILGPYTTPIHIHVDQDLTKTNGRKYNQYELQGVPIRLAVWARDIAAGTVEIARRDTKEKTTIPREEAAAYIIHTLHDIQNTLYTIQKKRLEANTIEVDTRDAFLAWLDAGKFIMAHRDGTPQTEAQIKELTKATIRCIPHNARQESWVCIYTQQPSTQRVLFARSY
jgi:prolyl-tRNA synthetase